MNPVALWFSRMDYLFYHGSIVDKAIIVGLISIPIIVMALFSVRHNKGVRDE